MAIDFPVKFSIFFQLMWFYREISAPLLFALAQMEPNIQWRTKQFRLKWGGLVEALDKKKIQV